MKHRLLRILKSLTQSEFAARGDAVRAESRAEVARMCAEGRAWEGMRKNAALLGIKTDGGARLKVIFGGRRHG
jgi:hypothetical protein